MPLNFYVICTRMQDYCGAPDGLAAQLKYDAGEEGIE